MELRHLKYYVAVAEERSFTRASRRLHVSQPVISRQIKDLEHELGVELLMRDTVKVSLTPAGEIYLEKAKAILGSVVDATLSLREFVQNQNKRLNVGYLAPFLGSFLSTSMSTFCQAHPSISLELLEMNPSRQIEELSKGNLDIALIGHACPILEKEFDLFTIQKVALCCVLPNKHPLAHRKTIRFADIAGEKLIGLSENTFPGRMELLKEIHKKAGYSLKISHQVDSLTTLFAYISSGKGICLIPEDAQEMAQKTVTFKPLIAPKSYITIQAAVQKGERRSPVRVFLQECRTAYT